MFICFKEKLGNVFFFFLFQNCYFISKHKENDIPDSRCLARVDLKGFSDTQFLCKKESIFIIYHAHMQTW